MRGTRPKSPRIIHLCVAARGIVGVLVWLPRDARLRARRPEMSTDRLQRLAVRTPQDGREMVFEDNDPPTTPDLIGFQSQSPSVGRTITFNVVPGLQVVSAADRIGNKVTTVSGYRIVDRWHGFTGLGTLWRRRCAVLGANGCRRAIRARPRASHASRRAARDWAPLETPPPRV